MSDNTEMKSQKKPELLIPASSLEVLRTAVLYGADAVYIGGEVFSLRAKAKNFSMDEMAEGIAFAHEHGVKVYVTANILAHNDDLTEAREYFTALRDLKYLPPVASTEGRKECKEARPDALIISDPGMFMVAREVWPDCEIHVSTQANNTNYETYLFWWKHGAKRVVSARELSLQEIREIRDHIPKEMEIESFIHGSMCISYSGRCLLSNYLTGRDANQGSCTHPCRWKYAVMEESRPGEYMPVYENERGTFLFNSKDLCMIEYVPEMVAVGIDSFKIEGRMKTALYVASVTRTYRKAIDDYFQDEEIYRTNMEWYRKEIAKCTYRQYSTGFYFGKPNAENQIYDNSTYVSESIYLGFVEEKTTISVDKIQPPMGEDGKEKQFHTETIELIRLTQRNKFCVGDHIEVMKRDGRDICVLVGAIYNENLEFMESAPHAKQKIWVWLVDDVNIEKVDVEAGDVLRVNAAT